MVVERAFPAEGAGAMLVVTFVRLFIAVDAEVTFEVVFAIELLLAARKIARMHDTHAKSRVQQ